MSKTEDPFIAALLRERVGYVQRGLTDRVAQVDEQLKQRGYTPSAAERAGSEKPEGRSARTRQTTD